VDYDEWFIREVEKGLAAADSGEFIDHEEIGNSRAFATTSISMTDRKQPSALRFESTKA
jgi:predicted transcriptional regulator